MNEVLTSAIPLAIPLVVSLFRQVVTKLPGKQIPAIVAVCGVVYGALTGQDSGDFMKFITEVMQGGSLALSGVGIHQVYRQAKPVE